MKGRSAEIYPSDDLHKSEGIETLRERNLHIFLALRIDRIISSAGQTLIKYHHLHNAGEVDRLNGDSVGLRIKITQN